MSAPKHVLGIDPASFHVGWCYLENGKHSNSGVISPPKKADLLTRRNFIREAVRELFVAFSSLPDLVVAVENPMSRSYGTIKILFTIKTMVEELAVVSGWGHVEVTPSEWHSLPLGEDRRKVDENIKDLALRLAKVHSDGAIELQDAADAYFVARYVFENADVKEKDPET